MIKFFGKIRHMLLSEKKFGKYLLYAIGEIVLVVIGILIALQVNNYNNRRIERTREIKYLKNIVLDLKKDIARLDYLIEFRKSRIISDQDLIDHINGKPINDLNKLSWNVVHSMWEEHFSPNNSTFTELASSGNLSLISNDKIKVLLLELDEIHKTNEMTIDHEEFDYREYISKQVIRYMKLNKLFPIYTGEKSVEEMHIVASDFTELFKSNEYENGLVIMTVMHKAYIPTYEDMRLKSKRIISMIKNELKK